MIRIHRATERGFADHGWLQTHHTFSFAGYFDPNRMGFRSLRVLNDDRVAPGAGFPTHPHDNMEILTYVVDGSLQHRDSLGHGSVIRAGEFQRMTAGTGVTHSEFNPSRTDPLRLLQIWILPDRRGRRPEYEQKRFDEAERRGRLRRVASPDGREGGLTIHQDVALYSGILAAGESAEHRIEPGRHAWLQVVRGDLRLAPAAGAGAAEDPLPLTEGDGVAISDEPALTLTGEADGGEVLLFDLA